MTIIRIEHASGDGIWRAVDKFRDSYFSKLSDNVRIPLYDKHFHFPTPCNDSLINRDLELDEYCAFKTIEQLQEWLDAVWIRELITLGFKVLMLDVSECLVGEYQIIYKKQNVLQTKDITSLFK